MLKKKEVLLFSRCVLKCVVDSMRKRLEVALDNAVLGLRHSWTALLVVAER